MADATSTAATASALPAAEAALPVIDVDTHCGYPPTQEALYEYLPARWSRWLERYGMRSAASYRQVPRARSFVHRLDAMPPSGMPGSDPEFAREQLLDEFGMSGAFLNLLASGVGGNEPNELGNELARASNELIREKWFAADPRWFGSISINASDPAAAAAEIERCAAEHRNWRQVMVSSKTDVPFGNPHHWPIVEAAVEHDLPLGFHVGVNRVNTDTGCGPVNHYYESHVAIAYGGYSVVPSMIFEGVFDRFPKLKVVLVELGWSWAVPLAWRMDAAMRVMGDEVAHLQRMPSEYFTEHFWMTTQPIDEPAHAEWIGELLAQAEGFGFADRLLFSSDYPHWDFDSPLDALPPTLPLDVRARVLGENASALYGIPLIDPKRAAA